MRLIADNETNMDNDKFDELFKLSNEILLLGLKNELALDLNDEDIEKILSKAEISLLLVDNEKIKEINNQYRNIDLATDVLSFPMYNDKFELYDEAEDDDIILLGDIVISVDKAIEQSKEYNHSFNREFGYLLIHSLMHLLGYDHMNEDDKNIMRKREEEILNLLSLTR